jgi:hypothetical protein
MTMTDGMTTVGVMMITTAGIQVANMNTMTVVIATEEKA